MSDSSGGIRFTSDGTTVYDGITVNTPYEKTSDQSVKVEDFLQLMIAQLTNQDFMNPADDTQYVTQLAQFATMQSMQELSYYSQTNYVTSLVGKSVTVAALGLGGQVNKDTGIVSSVSLSGDSYMITVNGKQYELSQVMNISDAASSVSQNDLDNAGKIALIIQDKTTDSITMRWDAPITDEALAKGLMYDVYITEDGQLDMSSLSGVKKATLEESDLTKGEYTISGLEPGKTYFINVVVRNGAGDQAVYQQSTVVTKS